MFESNKSVTPMSPGTEAFIVVGLVVPTSAVAACMETLAKVPDESCLAVILVNEGSDDISALRAAISGLRKEQEIREASDGLLLTANSIVWIRPGETFCVAAGRLRRISDDQAAFPRSSDILLHSLAHEFGPRAICIPDFRDLAGALLDFAFSERGTLFNRPNKLADRTPEMRPTAITAFRHSDRDADLDLVEKRSRLHVGAGHVDAPSITPHLSLGDRCRRLLIDQYAPAAIVINAENRCLFSMGRIERYFALLPIHPASDVLEMAHPYLRGQLQSAIEQARANNGRATISAARLHNVGEVASFHIDIQIIHDEADDLLLVCFVEDDHRLETPKPQASDSHEVASLREAIRTLEVLVNEQDQVERLLRAETLQHQPVIDELRRALSELQSEHQELRALNAQLQERLNQQDLACNQLHDILSSAQVAALHLDRELRICFFSPPQSSLLNIRPTDVGRPLADLRFFPADSHLLSDAEEVLRTQTVREREMQSEDGAWYERRITPYAGTQGEVAGVRIIFTDVTRRRLALEALDGVNQRTAFGNVARSRFLAGANHALRQPLQTIALLQGLLATFINDDNAKKLAVQLDQTLQVVTHMIDTLLHIDQLDNGVVTVETRSFNVNNILRRVRDEFTPRAKAQGITLRVVPSSISVKSDPLLVELLVRNLLDNIIRNAGPNCVLVGCRRTRDGLSLEVWAPGAELPAPLATLFDGRARVATQGDPGGWILVKRLADLLGHEVRYPSPISLNPHFRIGLNLPYALDKHDYEGRIAVSARQLPFQPHLSEQEVPIPNGLPVDPRSLTVLVVDDDADVRSSLRAILENYGAKVETYESAESFLDSHQVRRDACLVLDAHLPGMSGIELLNMLGDENRPRTLMITGRSDVVMAVQAMKAGAIDFIEKPIGASELITRIERAITSGREKGHSPALRNGADSRLSSLTPRQRQIMDMILEGHPSKIIANKLGISQRTVESHRATIMNKTGSKSVAALARFVLSNNRQLS